MSDPQREQEPEPYSRPQARKAASSSAALVAGAALLAGALVFADMRMRGDAPSDAGSKLKRCRPYADYVADQKSASVSDAQLIEEAACLCSLAGGYGVMDTDLTRTDLTRNPGNFDHLLSKVSSCPSGSTPVPYAPDAKIWKGDWIDDPGHWACICSSSPREEKIVTVPQSLSKMKFIAAPDTTP